MTKFSKIFSAMAAGALALTALSGCFTGIEKTPVIKDTGSSKTSAKLTAEQELLADIAPQPSGQWQSGKPFILTAGRLDYAYSPASVADKLHPGDTLRYASMKQGVRLSGDTITEVTLLTPSADKITTIVEMPPKEVADKPLALPFTVDAELVEAVRNRLTGKTVWTLRPDRQGRKYQKTQIRDVLSGTSDFPLRVVTGLDTTLMALSSRSASGRTFDNLFTLTDPRRRYANISDANWTLICAGNVAVDMTREECRLALGAPADVDRNVTYSGIIERWTYEDGRYLIFTDGLLTRFRL